jgi:hypothetical protein
MTNDKFSGPFLMAGEFVICHFSIVICHFGGKWGMTRLDPFFPNEKA